MSRVQLYVYDLSRGMAKSMSLALTGKQIDGIWHTSVVVFGREIFFGQGIMEAKPGTTHHGQPVQVIDCGTTEIDESTFQEYLSSLQDMYTPSAYHLIEFNCNHFTGDVVGFLTGGSIPTWISGLPTEFLSTPFGQAMRPQIDAMFRNTGPTEHRISSTPSSNSILNNVASRATAPSAPTPSTSMTKSTISPLTLVSSVSNFTSILGSHSAVIANFTNTPGCAPCRTIKPIYESLASNFSESYGARGARFVEIELGVGEGQDLAKKYGVSATPTFIFFRDGKKVEELKGASKKELEIKVEQFLEKCYPTHPHRKLYLPAVEGISLTPIIANQIPAYPALLKKLTTLGADSTAVETIKTKVIPFLEGAETPGLEDLLETWIEITTNLMRQMEPENTFPIIDLYRVALLDTRFSTLIVQRLSPETANVQPFFNIIHTASNTIARLTPAKTPKPYLLTLLRLLMNLTSILPIANILLTAAHSRLQGLQSDIIEILVESLLHPDVAVRTAAGSLALNISGWRHRLTRGENEVEIDWEVPAVSAILEGIGRETDEDVSHRLLAALGLMLWLSPGSLGSMQDVLEVLDAKTIIQTKAKGYKKKEVKKLAEEIASKVI